MGIRESRTKAHRFQGRSRGSHWHPLGKALRPPERLRPWLTEPKSLTVRLQRYCGNIHLRVIAQSLGEPFNDEGAGRLPLAVCRAVVPSSTGKASRCFEHLQAVWPEFLILTTWH